MKRYSVLFLLVCGLSACWTVSSAALPVKFTNLYSSSDAVIKLSGSAGFAVGQFNKAYYDSLSGANGPNNLYLNAYRTIPEPTWLTSAFIQLRVDADIHDRLHIAVAPEFRLYSNTFPSTVAQYWTYQYRSYYAATMAEAEATLKLGTVSNPYLQITTGIFPYKYNDDARNLGEYLFRTGCYPGYVFTSFDQPYAKLTGLKVSSEIIPNVHQDLLLTTETQVAPIYDWSLSYVINYSVPKLFELGGGVSFNRLLSVDDNVTSPKIAANRYLTSSGDTSYYSFKGTKLMAKASFDPKGLLPEDIASKFGKEDCKIFGEVAVLGVSSYKPYVYSGTTLVADTSFNYYEKLSERIPVMFGINVPTFKVLDILSLQAEWYGNRFSSAYYGSITEKALPISLDASLAKTSKYYFDYSKNDWKWSVYAKKSIGDNFSLVGQIANDHTHEEIYVNMNNIYYDVNEVFMKNSNWGWNLKLQYNF